MAWNKLLLPRTSVRKFKLKKMENVGQRTNFGLPRKESVPRRERLKVQQQGGFGLLTGGKHKKKALKLLCGKMLTSVRKLQSGKNLKCVGKL
jgi:hypothetical protein